MSFGGLQLRFLMVVVAGATVFAGLTGAVGYQIGYKHAIDAARSHLADLAGAVEKTAATATVAGDKTVLQEVIDGLARSSLVGGVTISKPDGTVIARQEKLARLTLEEPIVLNHKLVSPNNLQQDVGVVSIEGDMAQIKRSAEMQATTIALMVVAQTALIAVLLYVVAARLVSKPIIDLANTLRTMRPSTRARLKTSKRHVNDEIGILVDGANALLDANRIALRRERKLRAEVQAMEAQYREIFDSSSAGIFVLGPDGKLISGNPMVLKLIGSPVMQMKHLQGIDFLHHVFTQPESVQAMIEAAARRKEAVSRDLQLTLHDGSTRWVHCLISVQTSGTQAQSRGRLIEGVMYDITVRKQSEEFMQHRAEHDLLTGLKNRAAIEATLDRYLTEAAASHSKVSVMYVDLDGFKEVNDTLGHKAGDQVLVQVANRMRSAVRRSSDLIGRLGGDEFVVVLYSCGPSDFSLMKVASLLVKNLSEPIKIDGDKVAQVSASVGIACYPRHGTTRRQLMTAADAAMYSVKHSGKQAFAVAIEAPRTS